jgi:hypothetical protein
MSTVLRPLPPRVCLRVGVSGHRVPPKLPLEAEAPIRGTVDRALATVADVARTVQNDFHARWPRSDWGQAKGSAANAEFTVISSLAEGADRIVADAGLAAKFRIEAVLPFARAEYARDFATPESHAAFERLLASANSVFELDGKADMRPRAYEAAGLVMLANIDLLIAIWDGGEATGIGGTAQMVGHAIADGIPVLWIDPTRPGHLQLSWSRAGEVPPAHAIAHPKDTFRPTDEAGIRKCAAEILRPPSPREAGSFWSWLAQAPPLDLYLRERERRWNFCPWYPLLQLVFAGRALRRSDFHLPPALADSREQWDKYYFRAMPKDDVQRPAIETVLLPAFSIADHLAIYYALVYRSAYVFNFLFAAVASALAIFDLLVPGYGVPVLLELTIIAFILGTWGYGSIKGWHRRWLDYRRLAECLRHMRILAPVGSAGSSGRPGHGLDADEPDWVNWYAWSMRRLLPLPNCAVDAAYVQAVREAVRSAEIAEQRDYHASNDKRMMRLNNSISLVGVLLFVATLVSCAILYALPATNVLAPIVGGLTALLPATGAALGAIHVQGEFRTAAEQSRRTAKRLATIDAYLVSEPPDLVRLTDRVEHASRVMMADLRDWQTVFRTRRLTHS